VLAVLAIVAAALALILVVSGSLGDDGNSRPNQPRASRADHGGRGQPQGKQSKIPRSYEVQPGDSLELISQRTGVPVARIEALNPQIDALNLPVGARLQLR
jgi:LysM repeat protein